jgi:hypothetical protein
LDRRRERLPARGRRRHPGYEELRRVLADPRDAEHEEMRGWLGIAIAAW